MEELNYILSILYHTDYIINRKNNDYEFQICYKHGYVIYDSQKERIKLLYKNIMQQYIKQLNNEDYDEIFIKKEEIDFYSKEKINHIYAKIMVNYKNVLEDNDYLNQLKKEIIPFENQPEEKLLGMLIGSRLDMSDYTILIPLLIDKKLYVRRLIEEFGKFIEFDIEKIYINFIKHIDPIKDIHDLKNI